MSLDLQENAYYLSSRASGHGARIIFIKALEAHLPMVPRLVVPLNDVLDVRPLLCGAPLQPHVPASRTKARHLRGRHDIRD